MAGSTRAEERGQRHVSSGGGAVAPWQLAATPERGTAAAAASLGCTSPAYATDSSLSRRHQHLACSPTLHLPLLSAARAAGHCCAAIWAAGPFSPPHATHCLHEWQRRGPVPGMASLLRLDGLLYTAAASPLQPPPPALHASVLPPALTSRPLALQAAQVCYNARNRCSSRHTSHFLLHLQSRRLAAEPA